jgi:D-tyrosyl-tRNA(Tyr) deacylase
MRAVIQRVKNSSVRAAGEETGRIGTGLLVLLGVAENDTVADVEYMAEKIVNLRIFQDNQGKMNRSLLDTQGEMLVVSQFTLLGDCRKGRRPSFVKAAKPEKANNLYQRFVDEVKNRGIVVQTGKFGASMEVDLVNDGPVTLVVES